MTRKSPIKHRVCSHTRKNRSVREYQRDQVISFESLIKRGTFEGKDFKGLSPFEYFFGEVHMKKIPPKYIKAYGFFDEPKHGKPIASVLWKVR